MSDGIDQGAAGNSGSRSVQVEQSGGAEETAYGSHRRRKDIQGLRAIAVISVVAFHSGLPIPGGFTGVDIFFVISGFVITQLILRSHAQGTFTFGTFYARRAQRLLPALVLMVCVVIVLSFLLESPFGQQQTTAATAIGSVTFLANVVIARSIGGYFTPEAESNPLLNTWSLSVEEQFYLLFPLVLIISVAVASKILKSSRPRAVGPVLALTLLSLASFAVSLVWSLGLDPFGLTSQPETWAFYLLPARAWEFGVGAIVAVATTAGQLVPSKQVSRMLGILGAVCIGVGFFVITPVTAFPGLAALFPVLGAGAVIAAGYQRNPTSDVLAAGAMTRVGDWSYSIYLWHWPFIVFGVALWGGFWAAPVAALVALAPALGSYYLVENPIRRRIYARKRVALTAIGVSVLVICFSLLLGLFGGRANPEIARLDGERMTPTASEAANCFFPTFVDGQDLEASRQAACWLSPPGSNGWVLLAGDSHASHVSTGALQAANDLDLGLYSVSGGACPLQETPVSYSDLQNCDELNKHVWKMIDSDDPPAVVIISEKGVPTSAASTLAALKDRGIPVVWVRDVPRWAPAEQGVQHLPCTGGLVTFGCEFSLEEVTSHQNLTRMQERDLETAFPEVAFADARNLFCSGDLCSPIVDGRLMYRDNEHLNGYGSALLRPLLAEALVDQL